MIDNPSQAGTFADNEARQAARAIGDCNDQDPRHQPA